MIQLPPWVPPDLEVCRTDFTLTDFRAAILQEGRRLWWEAANTCPCRTARTIAGVTNDTHEPRSNCPGCAGSGVVYDGGQQIVGMLVGMREEQRRYNEFGPTAMGYGNVTLLPEHLPCIDDRLTLIDGVRVHNEIKKRQGAVETLRYPIITRTFITGTGPGYTTQKKVAVNVLHVRATDATGVLQSTVYVAGTHFTVTAAGAVDWTIGGDNVPPIGAWVSYRYLARPVFVVVDFAYITRDLYNRTTEDELSLGQHPVSVFVRAEHLGNRNPPVANFNPSPTFGMPG